MSVRKCKDCSTSLTKSEKNRRLKCQQCFTEQKILEKNNEISELLQKNTEALTEGLAVLKMIVQSSSGISSKNTALRRALQKNIKALRACMLKQQVARSYLQAYNSGYENFVRIRKIARSESRKKVVPLSLEVLRILARDGLSLRLVAVRLKTTQLQIVNFLKSKGITFEDISGHNERLARLTGLSIDQYHTLRAEIGIKRFARIRRLMRNIRKIGWGVTPSEERDRGSLILQMSALEIWEFYKQEAARLLPGTDPLEGFDIIAGINSQYCFARAKWSLPYKAGNIMLCTREEFGRKLGENNGKKN